jgi:hypothetical protein
MLCFATIHRGNLIKLSKEKTESVILYPSIQSFINVMIQNDRVVAFDSSLLDEYAGKINSGCKIYPNYEVESYISVADMTASEVEAYSLLFDLDITLAWWKLTTDAERRAYCSRSSVSSLLTTHLHSGDLTLLAKLINECIASCYGMADTAASEAVSEAASEYMRSDRLTVCYFDEEEVVKNRPYLVKA